VGRGKGRAGLLDSWFRPLSKASCKPFQVIIIFLNCSAFILFIQNRVQLPKKSGSFFNVSSYLCFQGRRVKKKVSSLENETFCP
jgi:hypothetical protein